MSLAHRTSETNLILGSAFKNYEILGVPEKLFTTMRLPVIAVFLRSWNDALQTDAVRDRLLKPLIPEVS
jgi:hypothetical protein